MAKYEKQVKELLEFIGGKENIRAVSHCMTRMRFVLEDAGRADEGRINDIDCVKGTFTQAGQYQVIIGNDVARFYNEFTKYAGIEGVSRDAVREAAKSRQPLFQRIMGALGEIFAPIIPALICGGLILGFRNIIGEIYFFDNGTKSLADLSQFWAGLYSFLWLIGEAVFHLLPVGIVWSITKKMGTTQILGIVLGLTLVSPQLLNGFSVAGASQIPVWDFGFFQVEKIGYQGQVITAILAGFVLVFLERFFKKHCPEVVSMIVVPFCSLVPAVFLAHSVVGPIGWKIGDFIANIVNMGLTSGLRWLFAAAFGFIYAPLVMTGLHHMTNAIDTQLVNTAGGTILWPMIALSNIAQGSAVWAMSILQKRNERARQVNVPACISCYLGVTEPALFGVSLKYKFPLLCGMAGSAAAAVISVGFGVEALSIGVGGLPGILSIKSEYYLYFLLAMAAAILIPLVLTLVIGARRLSPEQKGLDSERSGPAAPKSSSTMADEGGSKMTGAGGSTMTGAGGGPAAQRVGSKMTGAGGGPAVQRSGTQVLKAPLAGQVIPIEQIGDGVFSQKLMGDGVGIEPEGNRVVAPADGTVAVVMEDTGHACGLLLDNGMEILIHVGIDTVDMKGDGFKLYVKAGDRVRCGDLLLSFSPEKIEAAGHPKTTAVIITGEGVAKNIRFLTGMAAIAGETVIAAFE